MTISRRQFFKGAALGTALLASGVIQAKTLPVFAKSYDIVIVGGGGAGLAAACRAGQLGLSSIVLEKVGVLGGSSLLCGGQFSTFGTDIQKEKGMNDTEDTFYNDMIKTGKGMNDADVVRAYVKMSKIQYDFLTKELNVHPRGVMAASGMSVARAHTFNP